MKLDKDTLVCALIALSRAYDAESSIAASMRIDRAIQDVKVALSGMSVGNTGAFKEDELFKGLSSVCQECGAMVGIFNLHTEWHNKLLP